MISGLYSVLYLTYFIILDSVLYFADIECGFSHASPMNTQNQLLSEQIFLGTFCVFSLTLIDMIFRIFK